MTVQIEELRSGVLHIAATRPSMVPWVGLPYSAAIPLIFVCIEVTLLVGGFRGWGYGIGIFIAVAAPLRVLVSRDWYAVDVARVALATTALALDSRSWGGNTVSHFPIRPDLNRPRGCSHV